jgi:hypothetical protein
VRLWRRNVGGLEDRYGHHVRFAAPGQSDLYGLDARARHWEIEVKAASKKPTAAQLRWLRHMTELGAVAFWGDNCNDIERVAEAIVAGGRIVWGKGDNFWVDMPQRAFPEPVP